MKTVLLAMVNVLEVLSIILLIIFVLELNLSRTRRNGNV